MRSAKESAVTRESKLALILSFVLILVVGVLVSDHFSKATTMDPDQLDALNRQPLVQLPGAERNRIENAIDRVMPEENRFASIVPQDPEPVVIANGSGHTGSLLDELSNGLSNGLNNGMNNFNAPALANPVQITNSQIETQPATQPATRPLGAVNHTTYTVQEGDSLYRIAADALGDGNRWTEIQQLNADKVGSNGIINPGMTLKLPSSARVSVPKQAPTRSSIASKKSETSTSIYTVAAGDTLGEISMKLLGTSRRMNEFVKLNGLKDADDIRVGMKLKVPAK
tara:strand:- start:18280 stop:19131 length:852 start_codon:yes stop_codon:yes gene_type:complete